MKGGGSARLMKMMNRRRFLKSLSTLAAAPALGAQAAEPWKLNYLLASSMYGSLPLAEILPEVKKTGATGIELWPKKHGTQREELDAMGHEKFGAMLKDHGVQFGGTTRYDLGPFNLTEEIALVKPHAALAAEYGVTIGIENHINNLIDTPDSLRWLADCIRNVPGIGIALAPYHLPQETALLSDLIRHCDQKLTLFYAWEHGMGCMKPMPKEEELQQMPGRGKLDWKPLLSAMKDIRFTGKPEICLSRFRPICLKMP